MKNLAVPALAFSLLAACRGEAPPVSPTPSPELESLIQQQAESAAPGSEQVGALYRGIAVDHGEFEDFRVEVESGQCYYFVAAGDPTIEVFHLMVYKEDSKRPVSDDKQKGREAMTRYCPEKTQVAKFRGKVGRGAGHFAIGVFKKPNNEAVATEEKLDLDAIIKADAETAASGSTLVNLYESKGEKTDLYVQLEKGTCYWFIGAAQKQVDDYYIYLWDQQKKRLGETKADGNKAQFGYCATAAGMYHLQIKVDDASDAVKLGVFAKRGDGKSPATADLEKAITEEATSTAPGAKLQGTFRTATAKKTDFNIQFDKNKCYWIIAAAQPGTDSFSISLFDQNGNLKDRSAQAEGKGQVATCTNEGGMFKVQLRFDGSQSGEVKVGVFGKAK